MKSISQNISKSQHTHHKLNIERLLDEFLEDFPSVSRAQALQTLELAKEMLLTQAYAYSD